jgi:hypothetical protein
VRLLYDQYVPDSYRVTLTLRASFEATLRARCWLLSSQVEQRMPPSVFHSSLPPVPDGQSQARQRHGADPIHPELA